METKTFPTVVLNVVGLSGKLVGDNTPYLRRFAEQGEIFPLSTITPAVTCPVQATFATGLLPSEHGCVANGWYFKDLAEIWFWRQSNKLVSGEKIWEAARNFDPAFTCANLFWWYNMYSSVDYSATPRPIYMADGRKIPDVYAEPPDLRRVLEDRLGQFPLFNFWGPKANIISSRWIADCARLVLERHRPSLTLVYLPHLDYNLQRLGPDDPALAQDLRAIDAVCRDLIDYCRGQGMRVIVLSEYAVHAVSQPVHINRILRRENWIRVREELGTEKLDAGASPAFAVADHQIAHVYVQNPNDVPKVRELLEKTDGIAEVWGEMEKREAGLAHPRSGELIALAEFDRWFTYYYWLDDAKAPDFARTVDIHRKPGYDPVELFLGCSTIEVAWKILRKKMGFRTLLDVIPLDASLIKGSHGRVSDRPENGPVFMTTERGIVESRTVKAVDVKKYILRHCLGR